jgi:hypothetical protein
VSAVRIPCVILERMEAAANNGGQPILTLTLQMTAEQRRAAVLELLGDLPEQQAFEFMNAKFPEWFRATGDAS